MTRGLGKKGMFMPTTFEESNERLVWYIGEYNKYYDKCANQRKQLRQTNKLMKVYWVGVNTGYEAAHVNELRRRMIAYFGVEEVIKAERREIKRVP